MAKPLKGNYRTGPDTRGSFASIVGDAYGYPSGDAANIARKAAMQVYNTYGRRSGYSKKSQITAQAAIQGRVKGSYKKGGKVKETGLAKVHKGERVLTVQQNKKFEKAKKQVFGIKKYGKV